MGLHELAVTAFVAGPPLLTLVISSDLLLQLNDWSKDTIALNCPSAKEQHSADECDGVDPTDWLEVRHGNPQRAEFNRLISFG